MPLNHIIWKLFYRLSFLLSIKTVSEVWKATISAEEAAKLLGGKLWRAHIVLTWSSYAGKNYKWLVENDVGWTLMIVADFVSMSDQNELMNWQKTQLLEYVTSFPELMPPLDKKLKVSSLM